MTATPNTTAEALEKQFDELSADINEMLKRYRRLREDRLILIDACRRAVDRYGDPALIEVLLMVDTSIV